MVNFMGILIWATKSLTKQIMDFILQKNQKFIFVHGKILVDKNIGRKKTGFIFGDEFKSFWLSIPKAEAIHSLVIRTEEFYIKRKEDIGCSLWSFYD